MCNNENSIQDENVNVQLILKDVNMRITANIKRESLELFLISQKCSLCCQYFLLEIRDLLVAL